MHHSCGTLENWEGQHRSPGGAGAFYSVAPDGQRFLILKPNEQWEQSATQINVGLNWFEELKQKVPTGK